MTQDEQVAVLWAVAGFVLLVSITASFAEMVFGPSAVPARVRQLSRYGWPGAAGIRSSGGARIILFAFGIGLLAVIAYVCIGGLLDPSIKRTSLETVALSAQLIASVGWIATLVYRSRRRSSEPTR